AVLAAGAEGIPKIRTQRAPQALHSVAGREPTDDPDRVPHVPHREVGLTAHVEAATQPSENDGSGVARRVAEPGENGLEDIRRLVDLTLVQQLLPTLAVGDIPRRRLV